MSKKLYRVVFLKTKGINIGPMVDEYLGFRLVKIQHFVESHIEISDDYTYQTSEHSRIDTFTEEEIMEINPKFMEFAEEIQD